MPHLIATKSMRYATRRLLAGDEFVANNRDARVLVAIGKARPGSAPEVLPPPTKAEKAKAARAAVKKAAPSSKKAVAAEDLTALRVRYREVVGKNAFSGWDATEIKRRMKEAAKPA